MAAVQLHKWHFTKDCWEGYVHLKHDSASQMELPCQRKFKKQVSVIDRNPSTQLDAGQLQLAFHIGSWEIYLYLK